MGSPVTAIFVEHTIARNAESILRESGLQVDSILATSGDAVEREFERLSCSSPNDDSVFLSFQTHRDPKQSKVVLLMQAMPGTKGDMIEQVSLILSKPVSGL